MTNQQITMLIKLRKNCYEYVLYLGKIGLHNKSNPSDNSNEPEGVFVYNGKIMIAYRYSIYNLNLNLPD